MNSVVKYLHVREKEFKPEEFPAVSHSCALQMKPQPPLPPISLFSYQILLLYQLILDFFIAKLQTVLYIKNNKKNGLVNPSFRY